MSIEQITKEVWGEPSYSSHLVMTCHALRKKPLKDFTVEDLRIMIGQNMNPDLLIPVAIPVLENDICAEGDFYPGDLLNNVLRSDPAYWLAHKDEWLRIKKLCGEKLYLLEGNVSWKEINKHWENFSALF